jgi:hypothetical protein
VTLTVGNATANNTESSISRTVAAGSTVIIGVMDWNATNPPGKTPLTGSGTATERRDAGNGSSYAQYLCEWANVSAGTFSFGPNNYTSLKIAQAIAEVASSTGTTSVSQFAQVSNWFASAATSITGVSWVTGDAIVVVSGCENMTSSTLPPTPTNANLTFSSATSLVTPTDGSECGINWRYAIAGSTQSSQTISLTDPGGLQGGAGLWVIHEESGGITGTVAVTLAAFTSTASGTYTPAAITGTVAVTLGPFVSAASGTYTPPAITGTVAVTLASFVSTASGTYTPPPITGTSAQTLGSFTSTASGTVAGPGAITGTVAVTLGSFTSSASGTVTSPDVTGTVAVTLGSFVSTASGTYTPAAITGTVAVTLAAFTSTASGTYTPPAITGTSARTLASFVSTASGVVAGPGAIVGTVAVTLNPFTSTASGTVTSPAITGTVAVTLEAFICVAYETPPAVSVGRTYRVRAERGYLVPFENRVYLVRPAPRALEVV